MQILAMPNDMPHRNATPIHQIRKCTCPWTTRATTPAPVEWPTSTASFRSSVSSPRRDHRRRCPRHSPAKVGGGAQLCGSDRADERNRGSEVLKEICTRAEQHQDSISGNGFTGYCAARRKFRRSSYRANSAAADFRCASETCGKATSTTRSAANRSSSRVGRDRNSIGLIPRSLR